MKKLVILTLFILAVMSQNSAKAFDWRDYYLTCQELCKHILCQCDDAGMIDIPDKYEENDQTIRTKAEKYYRDTYWDEWKKSDYKDTSVIAKASKWIEVATKSKQIISLEHTFVCYEVIWYPVLRTGVFEWAYHKLDCLGNPGSAGWDKGRFLMDTYAYKAGYKQKTVIRGSQGACRISWGTDGTCQNGVKRMLFTFLPYPLDSSELPAKKKFKNVG